MPRQNVHIIVHFKVLTDKVEEFMDAARRTLIEPTRREAGCMLYDLWQDEADATRFVLVEQWENAAALEAHLAVPALQTAVAALRPFAAGPMEVHRYRSIHPAP
jgi:quinol monooxygenase YgiN